MAPSRAWRARRRQTTQPQPEFSSLLTLGLPTSATAAVLLAAFQNYGVQPGPFLFNSNPELVWGLIASLYVGNVMLLVLNLPLVGIWVKLLAIARPQLYAGILVFATIGIWGVSGAVVDLICMLPSAPSAMSCESTTSPSHPS